MPASRPMTELRKQAAAVILDRLKNDKVAKVAAELGVSRQAIYDIQKEKYSPSLSLVQRACEAWKTNFSFGGVRIDSESFGTAKTPPPVAAVQGDLFESLGTLDKSSFEVIETKPMGRALEITLRLTLPANKSAAG